MKQEIESLAVMPACTAHYRQIADIDHLTQFGPGEPLTRRDIRHRVKNGHGLFIATQHPDVLAFVLWRRHGTAVQIDRIAVHPYCWQRKVGSWLLDCLRVYHQQHHAVATMTAEVDLTNHGAIEFFIRNGWVVQSHRHTSLILKLG